MPLTHGREHARLAVGWTVQVVATPAALDFLDVPAVEALTGSPVRSQYRKPGEPRSRPADAIIVAPATYNTINKWAQGISDTYALGILAETTALGVPIVVLPFVNSALAARTPATFALLLGGTLLCRANLFLTTGRPSPRR